MILPAHIGLGQTPTQVQAMIQQAAASYNVPNLSAVATAVAQHESGFVPTAQNPNSSAAGIFQLISATQQGTGVTDPYNAQQNVNAGVSLLAQYYQKYGNWNQAIQAFSDGPGTVANGSPPSSQTLGLIDYVQSNGVDLSGSSPDLTFAGVTLPDFTGDSFSQSFGLPDVPDWVYVAALVVVGYGLVQFATEA